METAVAPSGSPSVRSVVWATTRGGGRDDLDRAQTGRAVGGWPGGRTWPSGTTGSCGRTTTCSRATRWAMRSRRPTRALDADLDVSAEEGKPQEVEPFSEAELLVPLERWFFGRSPRAERARPAKRVLLEATAVGAGAAPVRSGPAGRRGAARALERLERALAVVAEVDGVLGDVELDVGPDHVLAQLLGVAADGRQHLVAVRPAVGDRVAQDGGEPLDDVVGEARLARIPPSGTGACASRSNEAPRSSISRARRARRSAGPRG